MDDHERRLRGGMTRGDMLGESLMFAMSGVRLHIGQRFVPVRLTDEQREEIAGKVVANMTKHKDVWNLDEPLLNFFQGATMSATNFVALREVCPDSSSSQRLQCA
jgi:hypothetical protein